MTVFATFLTRAILVEGGAASRISSISPYDFDETKHMTDLHQLNTLEILALYAEKKLSPSEYWQSVEARIAAFEPVVNALYAYDPEDAQKQAAASTDRWQKGETVGPLDGIPVSLKELIATKGQPIPLGTKAVELVPAAEDAWSLRVAARMEPSFTQRRRAPTTECCHLACRASTS